MKPVCIVLYYLSCIICLVISCLTPDFCLALIWWPWLRSSVCTNGSGTNTVICHHSADSPCKPHRTLHWCQGWDNGWRGYYSTRRSYSSSWLRHYAASQDEFASTDIIVTWVSGMLKFSWALIFLNSLATIKQNTLPECVFCKLGVGFGEYLS